MNTDHDHPVTGGDRVSFVASDALVAALDQAAAHQGCTRSHLARVLVAEALRRAGTLDPGAPVTLHQARRARG